MNGICIIEQLANEVRHETATIPRNRYRIGSGRGSHWKQPEYRELARNQALALWSDPMHLAKVRKTRRATAKRKILEMRTKLKEGRG